MLISKVDEIKDMRNQIHDGLQERGFVPHCVICRMPMVVKARYSDGLRFWSCPKFLQCEGNGKIDNSIKNLIDEFCRTLGWDGPNTTLFNI